VRVGIVGGGEGWHRHQLEAGFIERGVAVNHYPVTQLCASIGTGSEQVCSGGKSLLDCQILIVRTIPGGSLEQIIFRMDVLRRLQDQGLKIYNSPLTIERTVDKYYTTSLLAAAGLPTPPTVVTEDYHEAMTAFHKLGGDVAVKPLFGSLGKGIVRVESLDLAYRVFRALTMGNYTYYLQQFIHHDNWDIRAFVLGDKVLAAMTREGQGWKTNIALGAKAAWRSLSAQEEQLALNAAAVLDADYAGVDLIYSKDGCLYVLEVNGIPGWQGLQTVCTFDITDAIVDYVLHKG
jgi:RimK family alpha-L-glutamate ligase